VERDAVAAGVGSLGLETETGNQAALSLYRELGFHTVGRLPAVPPAPELVVLLKRLKPGARPARPAEPPPPGPPGPR